MEEPFEMDQQGCARCDGDGHPRLLFLPFQLGSITFGGETVTHWARCPKTGEPILFVSKPIEEPS